MAKFTHFTKQMAQEKYPMYSLPPSMATSHMHEVLGTGQLGKLPWALCWATALKATPQQDLGGGLSHLSSLLPETFA